MLTGLKQGNLTFHHIKKKADGGPDTVDNGALLISDIHEWLHNNIECKNIELFRLINDCLKLYKQCIIEERQELIDQFTNEVMPLCREEYYEQRRLRKTRKRK